jgi:hypothetical protein
VQRCSGRVIVQLQRRKGRYWCTVDTKWQWMHAWHGVHSKAHTDFAAFGMVHTGSVVSCAGSSTSPVGSRLAVEMTHISMRLAICALLLKCCKRFRFRLTQVLVRVHGHGRFFSKALSLHCKAISTSTVTLSAKTQSTFGSRFYMSEVSVICTVRAPHARTKQQHAGLYSTPSTRERSLALAANATPRPSPQSLRVCIAHDTMSMLRELAARQQHR